MKYLVLALAIMSILSCTQKSNKSEGLAALDKSICSKFHNDVDTYRDVKVLAKALGKPDIDFPPAPENDPVIELAKKINSDTNNNLSTYEIHKTIDASIFCN